jgi:hypothetical protein
MALVARNSVEATENFIVVSRNLVEWCCVGSEDKPLLYTKAKRPLLRITAPDSLGSAQTIACRNMVIALHRPLCAPLILNLSSIPSVMGLVHRLNTSPHRIGSLIAISKGGTTNDERTMTQLNDQIHIVRPKECGLRLLAVWCWRTQRDEHHPEDVPQVTIRSKDMNLVRGRKDNTMT